MNELIGTVIFGVGLAFDFFGCLGLLRLPDIYNRLQAATKCVTLGTILILLGVLIHEGIGPLGIKALVCLVFVLITSPTAAHAIAKGAHNARVRLWKQSVIDMYEEDHTKVG